jgi:hypothetical protein
MLLTAQVQKKHSHIFWVRCAAHAMDLLLADIRKIGWVEKLRAQALRCIAFLVSHQLSLALVR